MKCPAGFNNHRYKTYGTNEPVDACVRCGHVHADAARRVREAAMPATPTKPLGLSCLVQCAVCGRVVRRRAATEWPYPAMHKHKVAEGWCWGRARLGTFVEARA